MEEKSTLPRSRERIYNDKFSKVNDLGQMRTGVYSQEQNCLKFSQAKGALKQSWSLSFKKYYIVLYMVTLLITSKTRIFSSSSLYWFFP